MRTRVGFTGGTLKDPTYRKLGDHTESVDLDFDPAAITFSELLQLFWKFHDPTVGLKRQYMSAIFYHDEEQKWLAEKSKDKAQESFSRPIVTEILAMDTFYEAEDYHQKYLLRNCGKLFHSLNLEGQALIKSHVAAKLNAFAGGFGSREEFEQNAGKWGLKQNETEVVQALLAGRGVQSATCGI